MKKLILLGTLASFISIASCEKEEIEPMIDPPAEEECKTDDVTYTNTISSILSGCTASSCHGSATPRSMANFTDAKAFASKGRILGAIKREAGFSAMPKGGSKLSACKISQVEAWVNAGFPE